jgi:putative protein-disulfide isomerase
MCSWCWGFEATKNRLFSSLPEDLQIQRLLGGLAVDSDLPMPDVMQLHLQNTWHRIEERIPGVKFNFDFWRNCRPRRSTYPACRAVIAARQQGNDYDEVMTASIQQAYYQEARNPSDNETLIELAEEAGLNTRLFSRDLLSDATQQSLLQEIHLSRELHADSFPSLVLKVADSVWPVTVDYNDASPMLELIEILLDQDSRR